MKYPAIFVTSPDSEEYSGLIKAELGSLAEISVASTLEETRNGYGQQSIILGRPDYVSEVVNSNAVRWVQSTWAGVTPLIKMPNASYTLTSVKGIFGPQMSEYVIGHILAHELKIEERQRFQKNRKWRPLTSGQMSHKTAGIMGTGSIGTAVAEAMGKLGVKTIGLSSSGKPTPHFSRVFSPSSFVKFLEQVDYLIGILPDLPSTTNLINTATLKRMKKTALLINVGRGNLIDENALSEALISNNLAGAILDVTKKEPLDTIDRLWGVPNLKLTAHTAAESRPKEIVSLFLKNLNHFVKGETLEGLVDFEKGY